MAFFSPTYYRRRITDITPSWLTAQGVKGILLDIDNTLTTHDNPALSPEIAAWLDAVRSLGIPMTVVSNNREDRVRPFAEKIGLGYEAHAGKPLARGYKAAVAKLGILPEECLAIGDQIFTDIVGANLARIPCVLLEPIEPEVEQKFIVFKRFWERLLLASPKRRKKKRADYGE